MYLMYFIAIESTISLDRQTCCNRRSFFHRVRSFFALSKQSIPKHKDTELNCHSIIKYIVILLIITEKLDLMW